MKFRDLALICRFPPRFFSFPGFRPGSSARSPPGSGSGSRGRGWVRTRQSSFLLISPSPFLPFSPACSASVSFDLLLSFSLSLIYSLSPFLPLASLLFVSRHPPPRFRSLSSSLPSHHYRLGDAQQFPFVHDDGPLPPPAVRPPYPRRFDPAGGTQKNRRRGLGC